MRLFSWWLYPEVDAYFVAHERVKETLASRLLPHQAVHACGIPIRAGFSLPFDAMTFRREHFIAPDAFVCLLMGGGEGLLPMEELIAAVAAWRICHIVAVTGGNSFCINGCCRCKSYSSGTGGGYLIVGCRRLTY